jgi:hypothetical protein
MSEKHLTELPWKQLSVKHKVKDNGFLKCLQLYGKLDATKETTKVAECLADMIDLAAKLKKINEANDEVADYLAEVVKEANKTKSLLPKPKPQAAEAKKDEEEEEGPDIKSRLVNALKKLKAPDAQPIEFVACAAKPFYGVLLAKSASDKIGQAHKKTLTELTKATKFIVGTCLYEQDSYTFVVDPVPSGLAGGLKKALKEYTELTYKVRVRDSQGLVVADGDTEVEQPEEAQAKTTTAKTDTTSTPKTETTAQTQTTASQSADTQLLNEFTVRFNTLKDKIVKAGETKTQVGNAIKEFAAQSVQHAKQREWVKANKLLDEVVEMMNKLAAVSQGAKPQPQPKPQPTGDTAEKKLERTMSTYLKGTNNLRTARENAEKALRELQSAILAQSEDEPFFADVQTKSQKLFDYLTPIDNSVIDKLEQALRADPELQIELNKKARELIQKQLAGIQNHPLAPFIAKNPFGTFRVREPLEVTLKDLERQLA